MGTLTLLSLCCLAAMVYTISGDEEANTAADMVGILKDDASPPIQLGASDGTAVANDAPQKAQLNAKGEEEDCNEEKQELKEDLIDQIGELEKKLENMRERKLFINKPVICMPRPPGAGATRDIAGLKARI